MAISRSGVNQIAQVGRKGAAAVGLALPAAAVGQVRSAAAGGRSGDRITDEVRRHAARICDIEREEMLLEFEFSKLVGEPQFLPDRQVFARFGFGRPVEALLLSQIYPFENYLAADGKPEVKIRKGRRSGFPTKRHLSLHRFCM